VLLGGIFGVGPHAELADIGRLTVAVAPAIVAAGPFYWRDRKDSGYLGGLGTIRYDVLQGQGADLHLTGGALLLDAYQEKIADVGEEWTSVFGYQAGIGFDANWRDAANCMYLDVAFLKIGSLPTVLFTFGGTQFL
jgi:hypothetical protein